MAKAEIVAGLDMGSGQVVCVIGRLDAETGRVVVLGSGRSACPGGLRGGVVVNIEGTAQAIVRAVNEAEEESGESIHNLFVGIRGSHIESFNHKGAINISRTDKEINAEDVALVIESARAVQISSDREILHTIPQDFSLDRQRGVPNPVGMEGSHLGVDVHLVTVSSSCLNNIYKAINQAGFNISEPAYGILAVGETVVTPEERELGVVLIDLGGQTVGIAVYFDSSIRYTKELQIGSDAITRDLAYGLKTSFSVAQQIKETYGDLSGEPLSEEEITFTGVDSRSERRILRQTVLEIIQPRVEEIFSFIQTDLQQSGFADFIPGGAIITGGGSSLRGIANIAGELLGMVVRLGLPTGLEGPEKILSHPSYATALGLLQYRPGGESSNLRRLTRRLPLFRRMRCWIEEVF